MENLGTAIGTCRSCGGVGVVNYPSLLCGVCFSEARAEAIGDPEAYLDELDEEDLAELQREQQEG